MQTVLDALGQAEKPIFTVLLIPVMFAGERCENAIIRALN
jgi:hypothetical protein